MAGVSLRIYYFHPKHCFDLSAGRTQHTALCCVYTTGWGKMFKKAFLPGADETYILEHQQPEGCIARS